MTRAAIHIEAQFGFSFADIAAIAQLAERLGYHALWSSDHLLWDTTSPQRNCLETWTTLTALTPMTSTLRLGSLVTCFSYRYPSMLGKVVACLDTISQGRIDCGIGAGWKDVEYKAYGISFPPLGTRMAQLKEAIQILKQLWTEDCFTYEGRHYQMYDAVCAPKPVQCPLPLWVGGQGEQKLLRLVAEEANGWNMVLGRTVEEVRNKLTILQRHCDTAKRDIQTIDKSLFIQTFIFDDERSYQRLLEDQAKKVGPNIVAALEHARALRLAGPPSQVVEALEEYQKLGFDYFIALFPYTHEAEQLQRYAEEVWPRLT